MYMWGSRIDGNAHGGIHALPFTEPEKPLEEGQRKPAEIAKIQQARLLAAMKSEHSTAQEIFDQEVTVQADAEIFEGHETSVKEIACQEFEKDLRSVKNLGYRVSDHAADRV